MLRNDDWRHAVFTPAGERRTGVNEAPCLVCYKRVFTSAALQAVAGQQ